MCIGVSEEGMRRVLKFWWDNTTLPKSKKINGTRALPKDTINKLIDVAEFLRRLCTLDPDLVDSDVDFKEISFVYGASASINEMPDFDLEDGNKINFIFNGIQLKANAALLLKFTSKVVIDITPGVPDWLTPGPDDIVIKEDEYTKRIEFFDAVVGINVTKAEGQVRWDKNENRIVGKITDLDIEFDLGWNLPDLVINWIVEHTCNILLDYLPEFPLSSSLFTTKIPNLDLTLETDIGELVANDVEAIAGANFNIKEMAKTVFVPKFIANRNPNSFEVHRASCDYVENILEINKVGYYVLLDAIKDGYDGCHDCLPEYHKREHL